MAGYEVFSAFYDALTENVEYEAWAEYILALFERFSEKRPQTVLRAARAVSRKGFCRGDCG